MFYDDNIEYSQERLVEDIDKIRTSLVNLAYRVRGEIRDDDVREGQDNRLMSIWAELKNLDDELRRVKLIVKERYLV